MTTTSPIVLPDDPSFGGEVQIDYPGYRSTRLRAPKRPLVTLPEELHPRRRPRLRRRDRVGERDHDLTRQHDGEPLGERIIVTGRVLDDDGRPIRNALVEVWQANAAGRYHHRGRPAPGAARPELHRAPGAASPTTTATTASSRSSRARIRGGTTRTPGGPRTSTSRSSAARSRERLVTQMYFPGDPLFPLRPDLQLGARPEGARAARLRVRPRDDEARLGARVPLGHRARPGGDGTTPIEDEHA